MIWREPYYVTETKFCVPEKANTQNIGVWSKEKFIDQERTSRRDMRPNGT